MSDQAENQQMQSNQPPPEKSGCMTWLGLILLLAAIAGCLFYFIARPAMEEQGIDVREKLDNAKIQAGETLNSVKDKLNSGKENITEKYNKFKESVEQVKDSETVEKIRNTADKIKKSEKLAETAEKIHDTGSELVDKAKEGDSWY